MPRTRLALIVLGGVLLVLVVLGALVAWRTVQVNDAMQQAVRDAQATRDALETGDQDQIDESLSALQSSASDADGLTSGWIWSMATILPMIGDDASGIRTAASVADDLGQGIAPLAQKATQLDQLLPQQGRVDIEAVRELQDPVDQAAKALMEARERLRGEDSSGYVERFKSKYRELTDLVDDAAGAMDSASVGVGLLPDLLGAGGPRNYLLVFQNNAEIRATGGLPGAMSIVSTNDGAVSLGRQDSAGAFGKRATTVLPLTPEERDVYSTELGTYMLDANFTPDWPRAAALIKARWEEVHPERLDGVITLDTVAVSYLLKATGPIEVGPYTLTAGNAVDILLSKVYADIPAPADQDVFFREVASTVFDKISSGAVGRPRDLLRALVRAGDEGRVAVNLTDDAEQQSIADRRVAGSTIDSSGEATGIDVSLLDGTGSKMSYYLDYDVQGTTTSCVGGTARVSLHARLATNPPADPTTLPKYVLGGEGVTVNPGEQLVTVRLLTPSGGSVSDFTIRGKSYEPKEQFLDGRQVSTAYLLLQPGKPADITWDVEAPAIGGSMPLHVTPGIDARNYSSSLRTAC